MMFRLMTFDEWKTINDDLKPGESVTSECESCNGDGEVRCPHCGSITDCEDCDGSGQVKREVTLLDMYRDQQRKDRQAISAFLEKYPKSALISAVK